MPADKKMQTLAGEIAGRIKDLLNENEDTVASALGLVILQILNSKYKPSLSEEDITLIIGNYPKAIDKDIQERSLSEAGLSQLLAILSSVSRIAIDYSPLTNSQSDQAKDNQPSTKALQANRFAGEAYLKMKEIGLTPFGSAKTMTILGVAMAQAEGLSPYKIVNFLHDAEVGVFKEAHINSKKNEAHAIAAISQQLGISKKEAAKYAESYKEMKRNGEI